MRVDRSAPAAVVSVWRGAARPAHGGCSFVAAGGVWAGCGVYACPTRGLDRSHAGIADGIADPFARLFDPAHRAGFNAVSILRYPAERRPARIQWLSTVAP